MQDMAGLSTRKTEGTEADQQYTLLQGKSLLPENIAFVTTPFYFS